jgi:Zn-dependent protease
MTHLIRLFSDAAGAPLTTQLVIGLAACWVALLVHEGGHLLAAFALGVRVWGVRVGCGPRLWSGQVRGVRVHLALLPAIGAVQLVDDDARAIGYRDIYRRVWRFEWVADSWKAPIISAAGGMANFAMALLLAHAAAPTGFIFYLIVASITGFLNLLPCVSSDGRHILRHLAAVRAAA